MTKFLSFLHHAAMILLVCILFTPAASAQSDAWLEELLKESQKQQQQRSQQSSNQGYQPPTREQGNQQTTNRMLDLLNEALKTPEGETEQQRRQRVYDYGTQQEKKFQQQRARNEDYYQARNKRIMQGPTSIDHGTAADYDDYAQKRRARLNRENPDAKPAGFGEGYAGGFEKTPAAQNSGITVNRSRRRSLSDLEAGVVIDVEDDPAPPPPVERHYCKCKNGDTLDFSGFMCIQYDRKGVSVDKYPSGNYPYTSQCTSDFKSTAEPGTDFTQ